MAKRTNDFGHLPEESEAESVERKIANSVERLLPIAKPLADHLSTLIDLGRRSGLGDFRGPLPIVEKAIPPGHHQINVEPWLPFRGNALWVDSRCADHFMIHDVRMGRVSHEAGFGPIPATMFAYRLDTLSLDDAERLKALTAWDFRAIVPGQKAILEVFNTSKVPQDFYGVFWGVIAAGGML